MAPFSSDNLDAFAPAAAPFDDPVWDDHAGVLELRAAARSIDAGDHAGALGRIDVVRGGPIPAELAPHVAVLEGIAAIAAGELARARRVLEAAWSTHPDVAALPTTLGAAQIAAEDAMSAAHCLYAALISDDPDHSLAVHRRRLTPLLQVLRATRR